MPALELLLTIAGAAVALAGLGMLAWALAGDRLRTRALRRRAQLRRCPRCWYDMRATDGLTCPECGRTARRGRSLLRTRRRWKLAAGALVVLAAGAGVGLYPRAKDGAWQRWVPDTAVILLMRFGPDPGWTVDELARRAWGEAGVPHVEHPHRFADWQLGLLTDACVRTVRTPELQKHHYTAWSMITRLSPATRDALPLAMQNLSATGATQYAASRFFVWRAGELPVEELRAAYLALDEFAVASGNDADRAASVARDLRAAIDTRSDEWQRRLATAAEVSLDPRAIARTLSPCSPDERAVLYRRLGLSLPAPMTAPGERTIAIDAREAFLDDDQAVDCILEFGPIYGHERDRLFFVRRGSSWRLVGRIEQGGMGADTDISSLSAPDGSRYLRMRHNDYTRAGFPRDAWFRVRSGRLRLVQLVTISGSVSGYTDRTLVSAEPQIVLARGRWHACYKVGARAEFNVYDEQFGPGRAVVIGEEVGEFLFALDAAPGAFGEPLHGGPWDGRRPEWILGPEEDLVARYLARLLEIARSDDEPARDELSHIVSLLGDTPELSTLRAALDEP